MIATISPASIEMFDAAQRLDRVPPTEAVGLAQVAAFKQCHVVQSSYS